MKPFKHLTLRSQRLRIIKDAIAQINADIIIVSAGVYMNINQHILRNSKGFGSFKKLLQQRAENTCVACAKGSLFAACVLNVNNCSVWAANRGEEALQKAKLCKWFKQGELDTIEAAFERVIVKDSAKNLFILSRTDHPRVTKLAKRAIAFGRKYEDPKNRLLAILNNILDKGTFLGYKY